MPTESPATAGSVGGAFQRSMLATTDDLFAGEKYQLIPWPKRSGFDTPCNDPTTIKAVDILNTKAQWKIGVRLSRLQKIERFENVRSTVPFHFHAGARDVLAVLRRCRNKRSRI